MVPELIRKEFQFVKELIIQVSLKHCIAAIIMFHWIRGKIKNAKLITSTLKIHVVLVTIYVIK